MIIYALIDKTNPTTFLTMTSSKKHAYEYARKIIKINNKHNFESWCNINNYLIEDEKIWNMYYDMFISDDEKDKYTIHRLIYRKRDICAIIRMFIGYVPLGCSFENEKEVQYFNEVHLNKGLEKKE